MSVVAFDGERLAADSQVTNANMAHRCQKLVEVPDLNAVLAFTGPTEEGLMLFEWFKAGSPTNEWPEFQKDPERWCRLIVAQPSGVVVYEQLPIPQPVLDPFMAWGSGRDFAMGALAYGANALDAVSIACQYEINCGPPVVWYPLP